MVQIRSVLQQSLNEMVSARTGSERKVAADDLVKAIESYLQSEEVLAEETMDVSAVAADTDALLKKRSSALATLSDEDLRRFNNLLPWAAMTVDPAGRVVGRAWNAAKRFAVHKLLDQRQVDFNTAHSLEGKHVLELGCFEGIHTLGLLLLGASVTAVDGRIENVLKTMARLWAYGFHCDVQQWDFEERPPADLPAQWDVLHHIGVLYHLSDPIRHLNDILPRTGDALLLDTHVADSLEAAEEVYDDGGVATRFRRKAEPYAASSPFAGMRDHAKYLVLEDLVSRIQDHGFKDTRVVSDRLERNGRRVTIWAFR